MNSSRTLNALEASAAASSALDPSLLALAREHRGMLTTVMARQFGLDKDALTELVRRGVLLHPGRGLYGVAALVDQAPELWHLHLAHGATLLYPDASFTGVTAVLAHGITVWNSPLQKPSLARPVDRCAAMVAFTVRPRTSASVPSPWGPTEPIPVALVQHCLDNGIGQGVVSADHALHTGRVTIEELTETAREMRRWPRSGRARSMLSFLSEKHESPGESLTNMGCAAYGIELVPQVRIYDDNGVVVARVDFRVKGTNVLVEFDGKMKYTEDGVLWDEKKREDRLRALGYVVVRITWADVMQGAGAVVAKVRAGLRHRDARRV
jgi:very-short-patch-repair endonuclease